MAKNAREWTNFLRTLIEAGTSSNAVTPRALNTLRVARWN
jgi:hypothetical protein